MNKFLALFDTQRSLVAYLIVVTALLFFGVFKFWPQSNDLADFPENQKTTLIEFESDSGVTVEGEFSPPVGPILLDSTELRISVKQEDSIRLQSVLTLHPEKRPLKEKNLLWLIILIGALGATLHGIISLSNYIGNKKFEASWTMWYLQRPLVGAILSLLFYFVIRAGFLKQLETNANFYTIVALSGLTGMFSKQALNKLSDLFDFIFQSDKEKNLKDKINSNPVPNIDSVSPVSVQKTTSETELTITGSDFIGKSIVRINNRDYKPEYKNSKQLMLKLGGADVQNTDILRIVVFNPPPEGGISNSVELRVE